MSDQNIYIPLPYNQHKWETGFNFISKNVYQKLKKHHLYILNKNKNFQADSP